MDFEVDLLPNNAGTAPFKIDDYDYAAEKLHLFSPLPQLFSRCGRHDNMVYQPGG